MTIIKKRFQNIYIYIYICVCVLILQPRIAPPSYEEALSSRTCSLRLNPRSLSYEERGTGGSYPSPPPPFRPQRTLYRGDEVTSTSCSGNGASSAYEGCHTSLTFTHSCPASNHGSIIATDCGSSSSSRNSTRQLTRSSRAEEIPDIYWEQAARELDFCTCRKCQVIKLLLSDYALEEEIYFYFLNITSSNPIVYSRHDIDSILKKSQIQIWTQE